MQVLAIERFKKAEYEEQRDTYTEQNKGAVAELDKEGYISAFWARKDKPGNLILMDVNSLREAKELLAKLPLVQEDIVTYGVLALEPHQLEEFMPELNEYTVLVYASAQTNPMSSDELKKILAVSRERNQAVDITGILLYNNGSFLQVLEGKERKVNALYKKIEKDTRHTRLVKITTFKSNKKLFSEWSMGYAEISEDEFESIEGLNDFFTQGNCFVDINEKQVSNILEAFKNGKWRQTIL